MKYCVKNLYIIFLNYFHYISEETGLKLFNILPNISQVSGTAKIWFPIYVIDEWNITSNLDPVYKENFIKDFKINFYVFMLYFWNMIVLYIIACRFNIYVDFLTEFNLV